MSVEHFDVLIVGAGLSGIGAGHYLQTLCPTKSYVILEGRGDLGGTWDLFRYPGVRSDSDMYTLGFSFRPWKDPKSIADGTAIHEYLRDTARELGVDQKVRYHHRVRSASWSSKNARWTIEASVGPNQEVVRFTAGFLYLCSGYYSYEGGYTPSFPGRDQFEGQIVHPQEWPKDLDYKGKRVVVIGSGATAVTLVPAMAPDAAHVTMLQRSPTYVVSLPAEDPLAKALGNVLPEETVSRVARWKNVVFNSLFYQLCRRAPNTARRLIRAGVARELPAEYIEAHFKPHYNPWDERLCLVPNADLFRAIKSGRASVVTDRIRTFTKKGILLESGNELEADIIVTATGLKLLACGGVQMYVDEKLVEPGKTFIYKGIMLSDVPNLALCLGYTNASWTLRAEIASQYVCQLLNHMDRQGHQQVLPHADESLEAQALLNLSSGYVRRAADDLPKQATKLPWFLPQNYVVDLVTMKMTSIEDKNLVFSSTSATT